MRVWARGRFLPDAQTPTPWAYFSELLHGSVTNVDRLPLLMSSGLHPFQSARWGRLLVLALAGTMLLQAAPVQSILSVVRHAQEHQCAHRGVCPRNPDGPCPCDHSGSADTESRDGPRLKACEGGHGGVLAPVTAPKWQSPETAGGPAPRVSGTEYSHLYQLLSSQRLGDEIFRPPRTTPPVRLT